MRKTAGMYGRKHEQKLTTLEIVGLVTGNKDSLLIAPLKTDVLGNRD